MWTWSAAESKTLVKSTYAPFPCRRACAGACAGALSRSLARLTTVTTRMGDQREGRRDLVAGGRVPSSLGKGPLSLWAKVKPGPMTLPSQCHHLALDGRGRWAPDKARAWHSSCSIASLPATCSHLLDPEIWLTSTGSAMARRVGCLPTHAMRMCRLRLPLLLLLPLPRLLLLLTSRRRRCAPLSSSRTLPFALCPSFGPLQTWTPPVPRLQLVHVPPTYTHTHTHAHVGTHMRGWRSTRSPKLMAASLARVHAKHRYVCVHLSVSMCVCADDVGLSSRLRHPIGCGT